MPTESHVGIASIPKFGTKIEQQARLLDQLNETRPKSMSALACRISSTRVAAESSPDPEGEVVRRSQASLEYQPRHGQSPLPTLEPPVVTIITLAEQHRLVNTVAALIRGTILEIACRISTRTDDVERSLLSHSTVLTRTQKRRCFRNVLRLFGDRSQVLDSIVAV